MKKVLIILGPTASGKSALGVRLARKFEGEIISADSRQVYKGLNIGNGKITRKEMRGVPHHLLDVADPKKQFTVANFLILTNQAIAKIVKNGKLPIVVGGSGFYIDAIAGTISLPEVPPNPKLRIRLAKKTNTALFKLLRKKDPKRARSIDPQNKLRLIRALEIVEALGQVPPVKHRVFNKKFVWVGLMRDDLDQRIKKRLTKRLDGMIREARLLHKNGLSYKRMHELGLEYRYLALYLQGKLDKSSMFEKLNTEIRRYSKRQMTWFSAKEGGSASPGGGKRRARNKKIKWFKPSEYKAIERYVRIILKGD